jgi:hypothetical protein
MSWIVFTPWTVVLECYQNKGNTYSQEMANIQYLVS